MRIERVESILTGGAHFVRVHTDTGLIGTGQSAAWAYPEATHAVVETFSHYLEGKDPLQSEQHWQAMYRMGPFRGSILGGAISAVDIALWDITGQHLDLPVWQLLGGKMRDRVRLHRLILGDHEPEQLAELAGRASAEGFTAVKFDPVPDSAHDMALPELVASVAARVQAARDAVGGTVDILVELHRKLNPTQVPPILLAVAPFHPLMVEDAIQIDSIASQAEIARRSDIAIAGGERMNNIWEFRELLSMGGSQHVRPDLGLAGGLTHVKKIAAIAESFHSSVVTHNFLGPVLTAASVHLDVSIPNFVVQEYSDIDDRTAQCYDSDLRREGGWMLLPATPGLGVRLTDSVVSGSTTNLTPLTTELHDWPSKADGSMAVAF